MTQQDATPQDCQVQVSDGGRWPSYRTCGRKVVGEISQYGKKIPACSLHVKAEQRRKAKDEAFDAQRKASEKAKDEADTAARKLTALGIKARAYFASGHGSGLGRWTGEVIVDPRQILAILEQTGGDAS
jgi:hypothetical protein